MVVLWSKLSHPNILKFLGAHEDTQRKKLTTISKWMTNGDIVRYIEYNSVNRLELVRSSAFPPPHPDFTILWSQLHGAAEGLKYLHDQSIVHADLNGVRIPLLQAHCFI